MEFHKRFVTPSLRTMPGEMLRALADFPFQRLAYALLKAGYTCPKECLSGRVCNWIQAREISSLTHTRDVVQKKLLADAEQFLVTVSHFLAPPTTERDVSGIWGTVPAEEKSELELPQTLAKLEGVIQISVGCLVAKKAKAAETGIAPGENEKTVQPAKTFDEIGRRLIKMLVTNIPQADVKALTALWPVPDAGVAPTNGKADTLSGPRPPVTLDLMEYDCDGEVTSTMAHLRFMGLDVASNVAKGGSLHLWTITSVTDQPAGVNLKFLESRYSLETAMDLFETETGVTKPVSSDNGAAAALTKLQQATQPETTFIPWGVFCKDWNAPPKAKIYAVHPKWPGSRPVGTKFFAAKSLQSYLYAALHKCGRESDITTKNGKRVAVFQKPSLQVRIAGGLPPYFRRQEQKVIKPFPMIFRPSFIWSLIQGLCFSRGRGEGGGGGLSPWLFRWLHFKTLINASFYPGMSLKAIGVRGCKTNSRRNNVDRNLWGT